MGLSSLATVQDGPETLHSSWAQANQYHGTLDLVKLLSLVVSIGCRAVRTTLSFPFYRGDSEVPWADRCERHYNVPTIDTFSCWLESLLFTSLLLVKPLLIPEPKTSNSLVALRRRSTARGTSSSAGTMTRVKHFIGISAVTPRVLLPLMLTFRTSGWAAVLMRDAPLVTITWAPSLLRLLETRSPEDLREHLRLPEEL